MLIIFILIYSETVSYTHKTHRHFYESINGGEPTCIDDDIPFDIPDSWEWCRCSSLINLQSGQDLTPDKYNTENKGVPYITGASNLEFGKIIINRWTEHPKTLAFADDILISCKGTVGELGILKEPSVHIARQIMAMRLLDISQQGYLYLFWLYQVDSLREKKQGLIPGISRDNILDTLIPLPPVNEQERICSAVAKRNSNLQKIEDSRARYKLILSETPTSLRQQLIQSAIQGHLVPQNPDDEPASVLLERIAEEIASKRGKKTAKSMSRIVRRGSKTYELFPDGSEKDISDGIPFEIPSSWEWCRIGAIFTLQAGKFISSASISEKSDKFPYPCYGGNGCRGYVGIFNRDGDYPLIGRQGALCGNINRATGKFYATEHAVCVESYYCANVDWLCLFLRALNLNRYATATAQPGLAVSTLNEVLFPLPPQEEQNRIAKTIRLLSASMPL